MGSFTCNPNVSLCIEKWEGPNSGITSFDNIGLAMLTVFQVRKLVFGTDLGSLIGNTQCGKFTFFCHSDFTWNQLLSFWSLKNCYFEKLWTLILWDFWHFQEWNFFKNLNLKLPKWLKWQSFTLRNKPKLISCKIRVTGKLLYFHTTVEYPQSKLSIRLPRSVQYGNLCEKRFHHLREICEWEYSLFIEILGEKLANFGVIPCEMAKITGIRCERDYTI